MAGMDLSFKRADRGSSVFWRIIAVAVGVGLIIALALILDARTGTPVDVENEDGIPVQTGEGTAPEGVADTSETTLSDPAADSAVEMGAGADVAGDGVTDEGAPSARTDESPERGVTETPGEGEPPVEPGSVVEDEDGAAADGETATEGEEAATEDGAAAEQTSEEDAAAADEGTSEAGEAPVASEGSETGTAEEGDAATTEAPENAPLEESAPGEPAEEQEAAAQDGDSEPVATMRRAQDDGTSEDAGPVAAIASGEEDEGSVPGDDTAASITEQGAEQPTDLVNDPNDGAPIDPDGGAGNFYPTPSGPEGRDDNPLTAE
ncbi:hypothetical protein [Histidinibacterium aquaticum]|uniref:Uncharacterized protein n=1 Tax=Histidinibacterium aquaticum TaxID=2613962 RepID=A0A5J5GDL3_9RHOB|nr:hypothetical protein [Histidinibacterium aquaticum]KAA9006161.1 hypothetical protein F3S47_16590 [Histidinibacterium aquaticum]